MKFWDSSALLSLIVAQSGKDDVKAIFDGDSGMVLWWGTTVELASEPSRVALLG